MSNAGHIGVDVAGGGRSNQRWRCAKRIVIHLQGQNHHAFWLEGKLTRGGLAGEWIEEVGIDPTLIIITDADQVCPQKTGRPLYFAGSLPGSVENRLAFVNFTFPGVKALIGDSEFTIGGGVMIHRPGGQAQGAFHLGPSGLSGRRYHAMEFSAEFLS